MPLAVQYAISLLEFVLVVFSILRTAFYESFIVIFSERLFYTAARTVQ